MIRMGKAEGVRGFIFMAYLLDLFHSGKEKDTIPSNCIPALSSALAYSRPKFNLEEFPMASHARLDSAEPVLCYDLQSISWLSMALGGIWGRLLGGHALNNLPIDKIFLRFSVLPAIQPIILRWAHIGLSLLSLLDIILVSRVNLACRISDKILVISGSALADAINQFKTKKKEASFWNPGSHRDISRCRG
ncbi:hypothetical protein D5086_003669 [Populus alba]|uniref:Uncharacterized protein n=1 Tax=Populus alba TaxID=43335 RepID=A0ACC4D5T2_POPAL